MKREDIKKFFPDATEEQLKGLLDINTADIGKAKGELETVKANLEKANGTLKEYETTIADLKKSAEGNEDFKKKFEELEQRIADEKAEAEKKAAKGVFFVIYRLCLCCDTLLFLTHLAKGRKECSVGGDGIEVWHARPPREADLIVVLLNREGFNLQGFLDEV